MSLDCKKDHARKSLFGYSAALILLGFVVVLVDQASKWAASEWLQNNPPQFYFGNLVCFRYALNPGGFLSLGGGLSQEMRQGLFIGANGVLLLGILAFLTIKARQLSGSISLCLSLVLAGGIGNMIDRVFNQGLVTDFVILRLGPFQTGVFNLADIAITCGSLGIALAVFFADSLPNANTAVSDIPVVQDHSK